MTSLKGIGFVDIEQDFTATAPDQSIQSTDKLINSNWKWPCWWFNMTGTGMLANKNF